MNISSVPSRRSLLFLLLLTAAAVLYTTVGILNNNSFRSMPLYLFLFFAGIGLTLSLGWLRGGFAVLLVLFGWVWLKKAFGSWTDVLALNNMLELGSALTAFAACAVYQRQLSRVLNLLDDSRQKLIQLDLLDEQVNLLKPVVGRLRLAEEEERSARYRRPFSLILILVQPRPEWTQDAAYEIFDDREIMRLVANTLKSTTRKTDIPFLVSQNQIGLILPETGYAGAHKALGNVRSQMSAAYFLDEEEQRTSIQACIQLRYGAATFQGCAQDGVNMLEAAEASLEESLRMYPGRRFQNSNVAWELVGEPTGEETSLPSRFMKQAPDNGGSRVSGAMDAYYPNQRGVK